jgi:hypothetical protein
LREAFAGAGLTLGEASVQQQMRRESQNPGSVRRSPGPDADDPVMTAGNARAIGLIDEYV